MSMIKIIGPGSWDFGEDQVVQIPVATGGLRGNDLRALIKRAGHYLADMTRKLELAPGEVPIHMIAVGTTESIGPNKNNDGFTRSACQKYHHTFKKYARFYRNHCNNDPHKSYGIVKESLYNPEMHRIELIVGLNGTKEAAGRNQGLIAEHTLEKLAAGRPVGVSMSCFPPGTLVMLSDETTRAIDRILPGDQVVTHTGGIGTVETVMKRDYIGDLVVLKTGDRILMATPNHRIWSGNSNDPHAPRIWNGWAEAGTLMPGDRVRSFYSRVSRCWQFLQIVALEHYEGPVYNLSVSGEHSYVANGIGVSNCKVAYDVCSCCGNRARNRGEYCDEDRCPGGGLKKYAGTVLSSGHILHADNPEPLFFDISDVGERPADRTAWVSGILDKTAAALLPELPAPGPVIRIAGPSPAGLPHHLARLAEDLAAVETLLLPWQLKSAAHPGELLPPPPSGFPHQLAALARAGVILSPVAWLKLAGVSDSDAAVVGASLADALPGIYSRASVIQPPWLDRPSNPALDRWAYRQADESGLLPGIMAKREKRAALYSTESSLLQEKIAADDMTSLAGLYAGYTLAALSVLEKHHGVNPLTRRALLAQNRCANSV
jgi:hypothetical protein